MLIESERGKKFASKKSYRSRFVGNHFDWFYFLFPQLCT